jgi:hypothetical protein
LCECGRAAAVAEGGGGWHRSGGGRDWLEQRIDDDRVESGGDLESGRDLESFRMKSKMTRDMLLFIGSKISAAILN